MFKSIARRSAFALTLTLVAAPLTAIYAQEPSQIITGTDPKPTGEASTAIFAIIPLLIALASA